jgi:Tol biopolymer transport system component
MPRSRARLTVLWAVVVSVIVTACSTTSVAQTRGPSPILNSTPTITAPSSSSTASSPEALASPVSLPSAGRILFVIEGGGHNRPAYLDSSGLHEIPTTPDATLSHAVWTSTDGIIFDSERDVRRHVFRMVLSASDVVELTSGADIQERPTISRDGSSIAYSDFVDSPNGADLGLHLANADGTNARALTKGGKTGGKGGDTAPTFSPDGRWIAFERGVDFDAGKAGLFIVRTDGSGLRRLADDAMGAGYPRWSPDGKRILFTQHLDATTFAPGPLWVVDVAGGRPAALTDPKDPGWSFEGDWSPDGQQIAYRYFVPGSSHSELRVIDADGTHSSTLWASDAETPDWGP